MYKNSTHNIDVTFTHLSLVNNWVQHLQDILESKFGHPMKGDHTSCSTEMEIFLLARKLLSDGLISPCALASLPTDVECFELEDILAKMKEAIFAKVKLFNATHVVDANSLHYPTLDPYNGIIMLLDDDMADNVLDKVHHLSVDMVVLVDLQAEDEVESGVKI